jgi:hypothetical protein
MRESLRFGNPADSIGSVCVLAVAARSSAVMAAQGTPFHAREEKSILKLPAA